MQIDQRFCQIQSHEGHKLSQICIFIKCLCASRWLCSECVRTKSHNHNDGIHGFSFYRTENQFMSHFKMKIQPFIDIKLESQDGNIIKCNYLKQINKDLSSLSFKQSFIQGLKEWNQVHFYHDLVILKDLIKNLIKNYENENIMVQNIDKIYLQLANGLRFLKTHEINILVNLDNCFQKIEIQLYQEILQCAEKYESYIYENNNDVYLQTIIQMVKDTQKKLLKLKDYINYQSYHLINEKDIDLDCVYLSQNNIFLPRFDYINHLLRIKISDLNSRKPIKYYFTSRSYEYLAFDYKWQYLIIYNQLNLSYYLLSRNKKFIKLIKKQKIKIEIVDFFKGLVVIGINKIMIIFDNLIQIRDFKNRCVNEINFQQELDINFKIVNYGRIKNIIVIIISNLLDRIYIYKDHENQPFIKFDPNRELSIKIEQITLTQNDTHLLTQDSYELKLWQIDYQRQQLSLINRLQINKLEYYQFSYNTSEYNIIRSLNCYMQILDKNFNIIYEIRRFTDKILFNKQLIVTLDQGCKNNQYIINILKKAKTDYDKLQQ